MKKLGQRAALLLSSTVFDKLAELYPYPVSWHPNRQCKFYQRGLIDREAMERQIKQYLDFLLKQDAPVQQLATSRSSSILDYQCLNCCLTQGE